MERSASPLAIAALIRLNKGMLTEDQLGAAKRALEKKRAALVEETKDLEVTPEFGSDIDQSEEETDEANALGTNLGIERALKTRIMDIDHALEKISNGSYGTCEKCGGEIGADLIAVDPESRLCKACKEISRI